MHYRTPYQGGAVRSWHITTQFQKRGINCEVITIHNKSSYEIHEIDDVKIHYLPVAYTNSFGFLKRVFAFWKFNVLAYHLIKKLSRPDLVYAISTPLTIGTLAIKIKKTLNIPFVFEIGDLWPEAPIQMGVLKSPVLINYFRKLEKRIYKDAIGLVSMSPAITDHVQSLGVKFNLVEIPNFADVEYYSEGRGHKNFNFFGKELFTLVSAGAVGKANHLEFVVNAARYMHENNKPVGFVIMGEGSEKERMEKLAQGLPNIRFLKFAPRPYVRDVLQSSDAVYLSYKDIQVLETGSPNRYFDALATGKMVITNFGGWVADLNYAHNCGLKTNPNDPADLWEKILPFIENKDLLIEKEGNALDLANKFTPVKKCEILAEWLASTAHIPLEINV